MLFDLAHLDSLWLQYVIIQFRFITIIYSITGQMILRWIAFSKWYYKMLGIKSSTKKNHSLNKTRIFRTTKLIECIKLKSRWD